MKEISEIKDALRDSRSETRDEFSRIRDRIEKVDEKVAAEIKNHAVDIKGLQTDVENKARFAGAIGGIFASAAITILGAVVWFILKVLVP